MFPHPDLVIAQASAHHADLRRSARPAPPKAKSRPARRTLGWLLVDIGLRLALAERKLALAERKTARALTRQAMSG